MACFFQMGITLGSHMMDYPLHPITFMFSIALELCFGIKLLQSTHILFFLRKQIQNSFGWEKNHQAKMALLERFQMEELYCTVKTILRLIMWYVFQSM